VQNQVVDAACESMERLGWGVLQLYVATFSYGSVGTMDELRHHLATGNGLGPGAVAVLRTTLHEALLEKGEPSPFYRDTALDSGR
jgi:hypothetical protein